MRLSLHNRMFGTPVRFNLKQLVKLESVVSSAMLESVHATQQFSWYLEGIRTRIARLKGEVPR